MKQRTYQIKTDGAGNLFKTYYHDKPRRRGEYVFWKREGDFDLFRHPSKKRAAHRFYNPAPKTDGGHERV